jgi:TPR repeat protein
MIAHLACPKGDAAASGRAGDLHQAWSSASLRGTEGEDDYQRACQGGYGQACYWVAQFFQEDSKALEATAALEKACKAKEGYACRDLGDIYHDADIKDPNIYVRAGIRQDFAKAHHYFALGCQFGNQDSCEMAK